MSDTKPAAKKAATKTAPVKPAPAPAAPAAEEAKAPAAAAPEVSDTKPPAETVAPAPAASIDIKPDTAPTPEAPTPAAVKAEKAAKAAALAAESNAEKIAEKREDFVADLLDKNLPGNAAESWTAKVIEAIDKGEPVSITDVDGAPVLEIHAGMLYQGNDALLVIAERLGRDLKVDVNQTVLKKFPKA